MIKFCLNQRQDTKVSVCLKGNIRRNFHPGWIWNVLPSFCYHIIIISAMLEELARPVWRHYFWPLPAFPLSFLGVWETAACLPAPNKFSFDSTPLQIHWEALVLRLRQSGPGVSPAVSERIEPGKVRFVSDRQPDAFRPEGLVIYVYIHKMQARTWCLD